MYQCSVCDKEFTSPGALNYHTTKRVCMKTNRCCSKCQKYFKSQQNLRYHYEHEVCLKQTTEKIKLQLKTPSDKMISDLLLKVAHLEGENKALKENPKNITNNNQQTQNNVLVFPKAYGKEDIEHIKQILGDIFGQVIKNQTFSSIPRLFTKIHNNIQLPEYHNVYSSGERSNYAMVSDGKSFKFCPKKTVIDQIIEDKRSILNQYIDENGDKLGDKVLQKYGRYQELLDDDPVFRKELEVEIGGLLLNMKAVIADDEKTRKLLDRVDEGQFELPEEEHT